MAYIDRLNRDEILEIAQSMGYDPKKAKDFKEYKDRIARMDLWDISKIRFFGNRYLNRKEDRMPRAGSSA